MRTKVSLNRRAAAIFLAVIMVTGMLAYNLRFASAGDGNTESTEPTAHTTSLEAVLETKTSPEYHYPSKENKTSPEASKWHEKTSEDITEHEPTTESTTEPESTTKESTAEETETTEPTTAEPPATTESDGNNSIKNEKDEKYEENEENTSGGECEADEDECECDEEVEAGDICEEPQHHFQKY